MSECHSQQIVFDKAALGPRILILGCSGSGKSTLARKLEVLVNIPVIHLDKLFWKPGWVMSERADFDLRLDAELAKESWIMDGNFDRSLPRRLARATDVLAYEFPRWFCIYRVLKRIATSYGRSRPDMADGCPEKIDFSFFKWIWNFPENVWKPTLKLLEENKKNVRILYFKHPKEADRFLGTLSSKEKNQ